MCGPVHRKQHRHERALRHSGLLPAGHGHVRVVSEVAGLLIILPQKSLYSNKVQVITIWIYKYYNNIFFYIFKIKNK